MPVGFVDKNKDLKDESYKPVNDNDKVHHELCKSPSCMRKVDS